MVQAAGPSTATYYRPYTLAASKTAALERPEPPVLHPSPVLSPQSVSAAPAAVPIDSQGLLENDVADFGSFPFVSTMARIEHPPLELKAPEPFADTNDADTDAADTFLTEKHLEKPAVRIGGRVVPAELIARTLPVYPEMARSARVQGSVVLKAVVSVQGVLEKIEIVSGHPLLVQAALDCVRKWRYRPGTLNERIVEMPISIRVDFVLKFN